MAIGTGLKYGLKDEVTSDDGPVLNWNGLGRNFIYEDQRFHEVRWLDINWAYNGMLPSSSPKEMVEKLLS
jgi:hypothetical protein